jgi:hypothetical protein
MNKKMSLILLLLPVVTLGASAPKLMNPFSVLKPAQLYQIQKEELNLKRLSILYQEHGLKLLLLGNKRFTVGQIFMGRLIINIGPNFFVLEGGKGPKKTEKVYIDRKDSN